MVREKPDRNRSTEKSVSFLEANGISFPFFSLLIR
jgi:hypothetical protein